MNDKELADKIRKKVSELNSLAKEALNRGLKVEYRDFSVTEFGGNRVPCILLEPRIEKVEPL